MPVSRVQAVKDNLLRSRPAYDIPGRHVGHRFGHVKRDADPAHRYGVGNPGREAFHLVNLRLGEPADDIGCVRYVRPAASGLMSWATRTPQGEHRVTPLLRRESCRRRPKTALMIASTCLSKRGGSSWAIFQTTAQSTPKHLWTARLRNARIPS